MKKNSGIFWLIFVLLVGCAKSSYAENLIFAGFTFSGEAAGIPARYPFLSELYKQKTPKGMSSLSSQVMARLG